MENTAGILGMNFGQLGIMSLPTSDTPRHNDYSITILGDVLFGRVVALVERKAVISSRLVLDHCWLIQNYHNALFVSLSWLFISLLMSWTHTS